MWSQSSQQEKNNESRNPAEIRENEKCFKGKIGNECFDPENKIRLKETLINTTEKQTKLWLMICILIK
jgi:hypothetical protein